MIKSLPVLFVVLLGYFIYELATTPVAVGYEVSIYEAFPVHFWALFILFLLTAILAVLFSNNNAVVYISISSLSVLILILALLPLQRGYICTDAGDSLSHLTYINNAASGNGLMLDQYHQDPYPLPHLLAVGLSKIGLNPQTSIQIVPILFYGAFVFLINRLADYYLNNQRLVLIITLMALVPTMAWFNHFYPSILFVYLIPALLYFILKKWWIPAGIVAAALPFIHPLSSLMLLSFITLLAVVLVVQGVKLNLKPAGAVMLIFVITWGGWLLALNNQIVPNFSHVVMSVTGQPFTGGAVLPESQFREILTGIRQADLSASGFIQLYVVRYGCLHFILGLALLYSIRVMYLWIVGGVKRVFYNTVAVMFLFCFILYIISFFVADYLILGRAYIFAYALGIIISGIFVYEALKRKWLRYAVVTGLLLIAVVGVFTVYDSPINKRPNQQLTQAELDAMNWLLENKQDGLPVYDLLGRQGRILTYITGPGYTELKGLQDYNARGLPFHFGYDKADRLSDVLTGDCYLMTDVRNIKVSQQVYPEYEGKWAFHPDDYAKLRSDNSAMVVYSNEGIDIYHINSEGAIR